MPLLEIDRDDLPAAAVPVHTQHGWDMSLLAFACDMAITLRDALAGLALVIKMTQSPMIAGADARVWPGNRYDICNGFRSRKGRRHRF
jgi:hypothetical protein